MTIGRIFSRLILRISSQSSVPRLFSTNSKPAAEAESTAQPNVRNLLFNEVKRSKSSITDVLDKWVNEGKQVKKAYISDLLIYFRNRKNFRAAVQLYDWMHNNSNIEISNADQAIQIDLLYKAEGIHSAEKYFSSLQEPEKTNRTYGALLSCYCREKVLDKALEIFDKMKTLNYTSTLNYNNVLSLFNNAEQPEKSLSLVQEMEEKNIAYNLFTYNMLINSYAALKDLDAMEGVVVKMGSSDTKPDWFTYGNLATIYFNSGLHEKALSFLRLMESAAIQHDKGASFESFRTSIKLYSVMNDLSGVNRAWEALKTVFPKPSSTAYLLMLLALYEVRNKENLEKIFKEWEESRRAYDFRLPNVLLQYYLSQNMNEEATSLYKRMQNRGTGPNLRALSLFTNLCIKNREMDLALKYLGKGLQKAKAQNCKWFPADETIKLFVDYFEVNGGAHRAEKFIQSMKKHDRVSNSLLLNFKAPVV